MSLTSQVANGTLNGTLIHNGATLTYPGGTISRGHDLVANGAAGLHLAMEEDHGPVQPGTQVTYAVTVGNTGTQSLPVSAAGVLSVATPVGTTFVSASAGGTASGGTVQWSIGSVDAGATQHYSFTVAVGAVLGDGTVLRSLAQLLDGTASLARAMTGTEVRVASPLTLTTTVTPDPGAPLGLLTYVLIATNTGTTALANLVLTDVTRNGATATVSEITGGGGCPSINSAVCAPGVIVSWPAFTLAPGQMQTVSLTSQVANGTPNGTLIHNAATLTYPGGTISQSRDVSVHQ